MREKDNSSDGDIGIAKNQRGNAFGNLMRKMLGREVDHTLIAYQPAGKKGVAKIDGPKLVLTDERTLNSREVSILPPYRIPIAHAKRGQRRKQQSR